MNSLFLVLIGVVTITTPLGEKKIELNSTTYAPKITICQEQVIEVEPISTPTPITCHNSWGITLSKNETKLLKQIVYLEAGNQNDNAIIAVTEVILNRLKNGTHGDDLKSVLSEKNQFSTYKNRNIAKVSEKVSNLVDGVLDGKSKRVLTPAYVYFRSGHEHSFGKNTIKVCDMYFSTN